jgi:formylglycine-generating enzyme
LTLTNTLSIYHNQNTSTLDTPVMTEGMVLIPAGPFLMGSEGWGEFEGPVHEVYLDDFWMDETPVTNRQFARFVQATGYQTEAEQVGEAWGCRQGEYQLLPGLYWQEYNIPGREDHPVVLVSWNDAEAYAKWIGRRLPTEAEWEKAARGGNTDQLYPWGSQQPNGTQSNFAKSATDIPPTTPVRQFQPNQYGLYDMVGNVWQWCADSFKPTFYTQSPRHNPLSLEGDTLKVRRGGSWNVIQSFRLRSANRGAMDAASAVPNVGFRCCRSR